MVMRKIFKICLLVLVRISLLCFVSFLFVFFSVCFVSCLFKQQWPVISQTDEVACMIKFSCEGKNSLIMKPSHPAGEHGTPGLGEMAPWVTLSLRWVMV